MRLAVKGANSTIGCPRALFLSMFIAVAACAPRDTILPGDREPLRPGQPSAEQIENRSVPLRLTRAASNGSWRQRAGSAAHVIRHPAFSATPSLQWSVAVGAGNDRKHRISADPVAADGRIFTIDSRAGVSAVSTAGGVLWSRDLTPASDSENDASGGGLAVVGGRLFVTTGFADLFALDPADGSVIWRQRLEAPASGPPTVADGIVYVVTRDSRALAIDADTGRVRWQLSGAPSVAGIVGAAAPAAGGGYVVFPYGSAQLVAAFPKGGLQVWRASVAGSRLGRAYAQIRDVTGDPAIRAGVVYAGNPSGRTVAVNLRDGEQIWSAREGATGPVWLEGNALFLVSDRSQLVRLDARNGKVIWAVPLPEFVPTRNLRRQRDVYPHFGPVLAGGLLWVASGDGKLRGFDPVDGALRHAADLPGGAASRPIVVDGVMYLLNTDGKLLAFR